MKPIVCSVAIVHELEEDADGVRVVECKPARAYSITAAGHVTLFSLNLVLYSFHLHIARRLACLFFTFC